MLQWVGVDGRLSLGPDGRLLVTRPAAPGETDRLRRLAGCTGVPALVAEGDELTMTWSPPLAVLLPEVLRDVVAVLADAHERGVTHGPFVADHLRTGPVVDGWTGGSPADDVAALGELVLGCGVPLGRDVEAVARRMVAADPGARPTMRAVADALTSPPARVATPRSVPRWVPAAAAVPVALAAVLLAGSGGAPAAAQATTTTSIAVTTTTSSTLLGPRPYEGVTRP